MNQSSLILQRYEALLTDLSSLKIPRFQVTREAHFKAEPLVVNLALKQLTHFVTNYSLQSNLFQFQDQERGTTELVKIPESGKEMVSVATFPTIFSHITQHQDRIIADNYIYTMGCKSWHNI